MYKIICDKSYFESVWCKQILSGLEGELFKRRIKYKVLTDADIMADDTVFIIGTDLKFIAKAVYKCNLQSITPTIVMNQQSRTIPGRYHCVTSDLNGSIAYILEKLKQNGKHHICMYGVNPTSATDLDRNQSFQKFMENEGVTFMNSGSLQTCFETFLAYDIPFDAVICVNDFVAVSLVKNLLNHDKNTLSHLEIISCSKSMISKYFARYIQSVDIKYSELGENAYRVSRLAEKGKNVSEITMTVKWETDSTPIMASPVTEDNTEGIDPFYTDPEIAPILCIEKLLTTCDTMDAEIINLLKSGTTYEKIAQKCFISEQSVKYRVKNYLKLCGLNKKSEFVALLNDYFITNLD